MAAAATVSHVFRRFLVTHDVPAGIMDSDVTAVGALPELSLATAAGTVILNAVPVIPVAVSPVSSAPAQALVGRKRARDAEASGTNTANNNQTAAISVAAALAALADEHQQVHQQVHQLHVREASESKVQKSSSTYSLDKSTEVNNDGNDIGYTKLPAKTTSLVHEQGACLTCKVCNKHFERRSNLNKHIRHVHERERLYQCNSCGLHFGQKSSIDKHILVVHLRQKRRASANNAQVQLQQAHTSDEPIYRLSSEF